MGLRLRKSPSLLDLIQRKLSEGTMFVANAAQNKNLISGVKKENDGAPEKLKASNFTASLLRIGCWEVCLRYFVLLVSLEIHFVDGFRLAESSLCPFPGSIKLNIRAT